MKLSIPSLIVTLLLFAIAGAVVGVPCLQGSFTLDALVVENASTASQRCETEFMSAVAAEMEATAGCDTSLRNAVKRELRELINLGNETLSRYVSSVCDHARERVVDVTTFGAIAAKANTNLDVKEFFDGGTYLNEEVGSIRTDDGVFINTVFQDVAQKELIEWPDIYNFQNCRAQAAMCCWVQDRHNDNGANDGNCVEEACVDKDPSDNTDICYVDLKRSKQSNHVAGGKAIFHDNFDKTNSQTEGKAHCHGFAWKKNNDSPSYRYRGNNLFYVSMYDHLYQRGYVRNVPGAPMCSCIEKAPIVSRADCTELEVAETYTFVYDAQKKSLTASISNVDITFNACTGIRKNGNNDLEDYYRRLIQSGDVPSNKQTAFFETVVGKNQCPSAIINFMADDGWVRNDDNDGDLDV